MATNAYAGWWENGKHFLTRQLSVVCNWISHAAELWLFTQVRRTAFKPEACLNVQVWFPSDLSEVHKVVDIRDSRNTRQRVQQSSSKVKPFLMHNFSLKPHLWHNVNRNTYYIFGRLLPTPITKFSAWGLRSLITNTSIEGEIRGH